MQNNGIKINIFDLKTGLITYDNAEYVRITSRDYNLLIMLDYAPIIGQIEGKVEIKLENRDIKLNGIKASFMNSKNIFNLMIQGEINE